MSQNMLHVHSEMGRDVHPKMQGVLDFKLADMIPDAAELATAS
jgi:hypothetical protein